jgi:phosphoglycolate phosphatase-like HAD superfamily hydrolase
MGVHEEGWRLAANAFIVPVTKLILKTYAGMPLNEIAKHMLKTSDDERIQAFVDLNHDFVMRNTHRIQAYPDFFEAEQQLSFPIWICTSSTEDFVMSIFDTHPLLAAYKKKCVYREMYSLGKPNPEPLLLTFKLAGNFKPENCLYVGDAYNDYLAAKAAGASFIYFSRDKNPDKRLPKDVIVISDHRDIIKYI